MADRFAGQTVLITGAGSGIGAAMAELFLSEGALVIGGDLDVSTIPSGVQAIRTDVSSAVDVQAMVQAAHDVNGRIDVLCNNAGIGSVHDVVDVEPDEWDRVFAVNVRGVYLGIKYALPHMLARQAGAIVNTASVAGMVGLRDRAAYCASKGAVIALTKQVAVQTAGTGVRCNCLCPGTVDSPWVGRLLDGAADPAASRAALVARQPVGRLGTPSEVAAAAVYLAGPDAAFITGTSLVIDGGLVAG